jgi:hypothetical protein
MDYNENKWYQLGLQNKTKTSTTYGKWEKKKHKYLTSEKFVEVYSTALLDYLDTLAEHDEKWHIEDVAIQNVAFAEIFYHVLGAIDQLEKEND